MSPPTANLTGWRWLPSRRLLICLALATLPLLFAAVWWDVIVLVAVLDGALLVGLVVDGLRMRRGVRLRVDRSVSARLSVGGDHPIQVTLVNLGVVPVRVWVRDTFPSGFLVAGGDLGTNDAVTLGGAPRVSTLALGHTAWSGASREESRLLGPGLALSASERLVVTTTARPARRGEAAFGDIHVRVQSGLGLATGQARVEAARVVRVYPNIRGAHQLGLANRFKDLARLGLKQIRRAGDGGEYAALREYAEGDRFRDIDWKATARRRRPIVREKEAERSQDVVLCVEVGRRMASRLGEMTRLDHAINVALLLAGAALAADDRVGVLIFSDTVHRWLPPRRGASQHRRILEMLYDVQPRLCHVEHREVAAWVMSRVRRRSLMVLLTDLGDEVASRPLVELTRCLRVRHLPLCVTLRDGALEAARRAELNEPEDVHQRVAAVELWREREVLKSELSRLGARVVDRPPAAVTVAAINAYVELKRRRAL